jgi:hypothetical protein
MKCSGEERFVTHVVDVDAACGEELWIFFAKDPCTENASTHVNFPLVR